MCYDIFLSVVIPTYNETDRLPRTLEEITPYLERMFKHYEIIIVDDNSPDGTAKYVESLATGDSRIRVLVQPKRFGKGASIRRGMLEAKGDYVLFMDADHATPINSIEKFFQEKGEHFVIAGVRTYQDDESKWRRILGLVATLLFHLIVFEKAVVDSQCGFKLFSKEVIEKIFPYCRVNGGMIDVEIFSIIHSRKIPCLYVPVAWDSKENSKINITKCIVNDPVELLKIRYRRNIGLYNKPVASQLQPWCHESA